MTTTTATDNYTRAKTAADALVAAGHVTGQGDAYTVQSTDGRNTYAVTRNRYDVWRCTCPAYRYNPITGIVGGPLCKHIIAAQQVAAATRPRPAIVGTGPNGRYTLADANRDLF